MKDQLLEIAASQPDERLRLNTVREYLQAHVLRSIQGAGGFAALAFQGGTALRFLHGLRRYSEDLDFALERPEHDRGLEHLSGVVRRDLTHSAHDVEVTLNLTRTVQVAMIKFPGLLHELDLSASPGKKLGIRIEVDTHPPAGAVLETRLVTRHFPLTLRVHDLSSCLAGKLHALLTRGHAKGRDLFDLAWYLTHPERPLPNFTLLGNALEQTGWKGPRLDEAAWRQILVEHVAALDWKAVTADVDPFLEDARDRSLLDRDLLLTELKR